jgi:hypothetical protein
MTRHLDDDDYGDWLYHKQRDDELNRLGVIARPAPRPQPAAYAPPQWKPTYPGEQPPF